MSSFTTPLVLEMLPERNFRVAQQFRYRVGSMESEDIITVPVGFETDLASIPRILWWLLPPHGTYGKAGVMHDYLYRKGLRTRKEADDLFYEAMGVLGVANWKRGIMYYAVRLFGSSSYKG
jgi:hypothetical protein